MHSYLEYKDCKNRDMIMPKVSNHLVDLQYEKQDNTWGFALINVGKKLSKSGVWTWKIARSSETRGFFLEIKFKYNRISANFTIRNKNLTVKSANLQKKCKSYRIKCKMYRKSVYISVLNRLL